VRAADPLILTMTRSALKPLQAMPFVASGGVRISFGYSRAKSRCSARRPAFPRHVEAKVADMLARAG
jgi:L-asparaginase II